jgi:hypothetical protein
MGAADPRSTRVYWSYKSVSGTVGSYDKLLGYDYLLDRFFPVNTPVNSCSASRNPASRWKASTASPARSMP